jgi:hypothetical protein
MVRESRAQKGGREPCSGKTSRNHLRKKNEETYMSNSLIPIVLYPVVALLPLILAIFIPTEAFSFLIFLFKKVRSTSSNVKIVRRSKTIRLQ